MKYTSILMIPVLWMGVSCSTEPLEEEQYKKQIYIVNSDESDIYYHRKMNFEEGETETFISVACAGSRPQDCDVTVELEIVDSLVTNYNLRFFENDTSKYLQLLPAEHYRIPEMKVVLEAGGNPYTALPVYINTQGLDPDVKYVIPFRIRSVSAYEVNPAISEMLFGFDLVNKYSDIYSMTGKKYNSLDVKSNIAGSREMWAMTFNSVRMFIDMRTEDEENIGQDGMILVVNADNSVSIKAYDPEKLELVDLGGSSYDPATKTFRLNYKYLNAKDDAWYRIEETLSSSKSK